MNPQHDVCEGSGKSETMEGMIKDCTDNSLTVNYFKGQNQSVLLGGGYN